MRAIALVAVLLSCHPSPAPTPSRAPHHECSCPPSVSAELMEVQSERDECQAELHTITVPKTRTKVVERTVEQLIPCGESPPVIEPIQTFECLKGMICLDTRAQARLATNIAAYEAYVRRCEKGK